jgi:hypothetical protein
MVKAVPILDTSDFITFLTAIRKSKYKQNVYKTFISRLWIFLPAAAILSLRK